MAATASRPVIAWCARIAGIETDATGVPNGDAIVSAPAIAIREDREGREGHPRRERDVTAPVTAPATAPTERPRIIDAGPIPSVARTGSQSTEKEFWEIWSEEKAARTVPATDAASVGGGRGRTHARSRRALGSG